MLHLSILKMFTPRLSKALQIVNDYKSRPGYNPHWYGVPVDMLIEQIGDVRVCDVTPEHIAAWYEIARNRKHFKTGKRLSAYTVDSYARALKSFFGHMVRMGHIDESPCKKMVLPRLPRTQKNAISEKDLEALLREASRKLRDHAIILTLMDTGARVGEIASLTIDRIDVERCRAAVFDSKTNQVRPVFFTEHTADILAKYIYTRPEGAPAGFFLNNNGDALTETGIYQMIRRVGSRAGVKTHPHAFRHRFAKELKKRRVDPEIISQLIGHRDTRTYQAVYGLTSGDELASYYREYLDNANPNGVQSGRNEQSLNPYRSKK